MYFVGKTKMKVGKEVRLPGNKLPEASSFANLRRLLMKGYVVCDYRDGEPHVTQMAPIARSSIPTVEMMCAKIKADTGVQVPPGTVDREIRKTYCALINGEALPPTKFLTPVEIPSDPADALLDTLGDIDENTHLATIKSVLKRAGIDAKNMTKDDALDKVAELLSGA